MCRLLSVGDLSRLFGMAGLLMEIQLGGVYGVGKCWVLLGLTGINGGFMDCWGYGIRRFVGGVYFGVDYVACLL